MTRPAELLLSGRIATLTGRAGFGWVEAIAIARGRVVAAGALAEVEAAAGRGTRRLALGGRYVVLPALTDAHLHLTDAALAEHQLHLDGLALPAALSRLAALHADRRAAGDQRGWITGMGWSLDALGDWPDADDLEQAAPGRPVALWSHDLHTRWVSRAALAQAGIMAATADPPGGRISRDERGAPTGILLEHAAGLIDRAVPPLGDDDLAAAIGSYARRLAQLGVVGCHDPGGLAPDPDLHRGPALYGRLAARGSLPLRVHGSVRPEQLDEAIGRGLRSGGDASAGDRSSPGLPRARVGWLKLFADGALGSRSAALLAPYADGGGRGQLLIAPGALRELVERAARAGIAPQIHVIGDRALRLALDVLGQVQAARDMPSWARLEHVQLAATSDVDRLAPLRLASSVQPAHLLGDAAMARRAWPRRLARAYRWASLAATGMPLAFGSDAPVESPDPWPGLATAVTRRLPGSPRAFPGAERLALARAIRAAALDPVFIAGEGEEGGRLLPGRRADLIVIPADALAEPVRPGGALAVCRPLLTMLEGVEVARQAGFDR